MPYDDVDVNQLLDDLAEREFIIRYEIAGARYITIPNFLKHQRPHPKEAASAIPPPASGVGAGREEVILDREKVSPLRETDGSSPSGREGALDTQEGKESRRDASELGVGFATFWTAYPKKKAKEDARKAWAKLRPSPEEVTTILSALDQHKLTDEWARDDGRFIPHPATWLRDRRWEDQLTPAPMPRSAHTAPAPSVVDQLLQAEAEVAAANQSLAGTTEL